MSPALNAVPFVNVENMMKLVLDIGVERFIQQLAEVIEQDFCRWPVFDKISRVASHSGRGTAQHSEHRVATRPPT